jgi:hypothetical protein
VGQIPSDRFLGAGIDQHHKEDDNPSAKMKKPAWHTMGYPEEKGKPLPEGPSVKPIGDPAGFGKLPLHE